MPDRAISSCSARLALAVSLLACGASVCSRDKSGPDRTTVVDARPSAIGAGGTVGTEPARPGAAGAAPAGDATTAEAPPAPGVTARVGTAPLWATWPIPNPRTTGLPHPASYEIDPTGSVVDKVTGLQWQKKPDAKGYSWNDAWDVCARLALGGHTDWRLPSRIELSSIVDSTRSNPAIDPRAFPRTPKDPFWTSSVLAANPSGAAWSVHFDLGDPKSDPTNSVFRVRCVRAPGATKSDKPKASLSAPSYELQGDTVHDRGTGLTWQRTVPAQGFTFSEARGYCASLRLGEMATESWRVPSLGELLSLIDERTWNPTIDRKAFPKTSTEGSWTSSAVAGKPTMAWQVTFEHGNAFPAPVKEAHPVRCVR